MSKIYKKKKVCIWGRVPQNVSEVLSTTAWEKNDSTIYEIFYPTPSSIEY